MSNGERALCWWPTFDGWDAAARAVQAAAGRGELALPFYTFSEWCKRLEAESGGAWGRVGAAHKGLMYADYLRELRTALLYCRLNKISVRLKIGKADAGMASEAAGWMSEGARFSDDMPDVFVQEEASECRADSREETTAVVNFFSHFPESPLMDCAVVFLRAGNKRLGRIALWPNPALGSRASSALDEALIRVMREKNVVKACVVQKKLPFPADWFDEELPALGVVGGIGAAGGDVSLDEIFSHFKKYFKKRSEKQMPVSFRA